MTLVLTAWVRCDACMRVLGMFPVENDYSAADAILDMADSEGWDVPYARTGPLPRVSALPARNVWTRNVGG